MGKKLVSETELLQILNKELWKDEDLKDCRFVSMLRLKGVDEDGCNWSDPKIRCSGMPAETCRPIAGRIIQEARKKYNLEYR